MTVTDTHTETDVDELAVHAPSQGDGLYRLIASNDHKMVGRLWIGASLLFLLLLAVLGLVNDLERADSGGFSIFTGASSYFQGWVLFRTGIIFMVVVPLFIGLATAVVPLQVGSAAIAFPRLAAAAFWTWLFSSIAHALSFASDGGFGFAAMTSSSSTLLSITTFATMLIAILAASVCLATTIVALRPAGMTLLRVPTFSWSMLVATSVWLFSLPVLLANLIFSYVDLRFGEDVVAFGNADGIWDQILWAWSAPQVFAYALPVLGIFGEILPVKTKQRQPGRDVILAFIGLTGLLSFGAWAQTALSKGSHPSFQRTIPAQDAEGNLILDSAGDPTFLVGEDNGNFIYEEFLYIAFAAVIILPLLALLGGALDGARRGETPKPDGALLGATAGMLLLIGAALVGLIRAVPFTDALVSSTAVGENEIEHVLLSSITAQLGLVIGASLAAVVAGLVHWAPKLFGGYAGGAPAMGGVLAFMGGGAVLGIANLLSALDGQPDVAVAATGSDLVDTMNLLSVVGSALLILGAISALGTILPALTSDETLPDDPWDGHTLEWAAPSPPPLGNFVDPIAPVISSEPLLDEFEEVN